MAGKYGPPSGFLLVDGYNMLADLGVPGLEHGHEAKLVRSDGIGDAFEAVTPTGKSVVTLSQQAGWFDTAALKSHAALSSSVPSSPQDTARVVCCGFAGQTIGVPFIGYEGAFSRSYKPLVEMDTLTKANVEYAISGQADYGVILQPLAIKTVDWDTESTPVDYKDDPTQRVIPITSNSQASPSVVTTPVPHGLVSGDIVWIAGVSNSDADINGQQTATVLTALTFSVAVDATTSAGTGGTVVKANSVDGGVGYQQVTAFSGFSGYIGKIRDSPDDITYADLITFTDVTAAPGKERLTVAGTVDRYLAVDGNVTGTGSTTVFIGFKRNPPA